MLIRLTAPVTRDKFLCALSLRRSAALRAILPAMTGKKPITPAERRARMQAMFDKEYAILAEDYEFFTGIRYSDILPDAPKRLSKAPRTSEKLTSQPSPKLS
jgi:hypothetical protein